MRDFETPITEQREVVSGSVRDMLCAADAELTNAMQLAREILCAVRRPEQPQGDPRAEAPAEGPRDLQSAAGLLAEKARDVNILIAQLRGLLFG